MINIGLVGIGGRVFGYLQNIICRFKEEVKITAIAELKEERLQAVRDLLGEGINTCRDYREILKKSDVDTVIICTPDNTHEEIAVESFRAGKHVILEKPLAITPEGCDRVLKERDKAGKIPIMGLVLRYTPFHQTLKKLLSEGVIGRFYTISMLDYYSGGITYFRRWNRFSKVTGGLLIHKGCHAFDILSWLADSQPSTVFVLGLWISSSQGQSQ